MDNYSKYQKYKYQKYKFKYLKLKNQMGGGPTEEVTKIVTRIMTKYKETFKNIHVNFLSMTKYADADISTKVKYISDYISEYISTLGINSVHQCIVVENCDTGNEFYRSIFYTVYYIINNLQEYNNKPTRTTIMKNIKYIVFCISMLFWASCNVVLKENANRYTCEGRLANFSFLKKPDRKVIDKKYAMSFADFKKLNKNLSL